ncbi:MAG: KH domain-containing protein [Cyanobacteria bacterium P01_D01_bin.73]
MSSSPENSATPDYPALVRFFLEPLLDAPDSLTIDCEAVASRGRVWIRVALDPSDRGRAFGRDGRTLQALRAAVGQAGTLTGQKATVEVYGERSQSSRGDDGGGGRSSGRPPRRGPSSRSTPVPRPRRKDS